MSAIVITSNTELYDQLGEHLRRLVSLSDDSTHDDGGLRLAVNNARPALAAYLAERERRMHTGRTTTVISGGEA